MKSAVVNKETCKLTFTNPATLELIDFNIKRAGLRLVKYNVTGNKNIAFDGHENCEWTIEGLDPENIDMGGQKITECNKIFIKYDKKWEDSFVNNNVSEHINRLYIWELDFTNLSVTLKNRKFWYYLSSFQSLHVI